MRFVSLLFFLAPILVSAQSGDLQSARASAEVDLRAVVEELSRTRAEITRERIPLAQERNELEQQLLDRRRAHERLLRQRDNRSVELGQLEREVAGRREEMIYVRNFVDEFFRSLQAESHIAEAAAIESLLAPLRQADDTEGTGIEAHLAALDGAVARLRERVGGSSFPGRAAAPDGEIVEGTFALVGPLAYFSAGAGQPAGWAEERVGSLLPHLVSLGSAGNEEIRATIAAGQGRLPIDVTGGNAVLRATAQETLWQQIRRGGIVMIPILLLAAGALVVAILKWVQISGMKTAAPSTLREIFGALGGGDRRKAEEHAAAVQGPVGGLLVAAVQHAHVQKELLEEILYEKVLEARPRLERFLPFLALTAATAPLLGLLGTVTGMINTFQVITLFGTGDARTLSGGISEALITTKFGLAVAIAALIVHALLSRRAKRVLSGMEQTGVAFLNGLPELEKPARG